MEKFIYKKPRLKQIPCGNGQVKSILLEPEVFSYDYELTENRLIVNGKYLPIAYSHEFTLKCLKTRIKTNDVERLNRLFHDDFWKIHTHYAFEHVMQFGREVSTETEHSPKDHVRV